MADNKGVTETLFSAERVSHILIDDARRTPDYVFRAVSLSLDQQHRLTVLAAGVLGVVIPVLAKSGIPATDWMLRRAIYATAVSVVAGVVVSGVARLMLTPLLKAFKEAADVQSENVGAALYNGDHAAIAAALTAPMPLSASRKRQLQWFAGVWWVLEIVQYLAFVTAALYIARAF